MASKMRLSLLTNLIITAIVFGNIASAQAFETKAKYAFLIDASTDTILFEKEPDVQMAPSSMSKLMTVYILFDRLKSGAVKIDDKFKVSEKAWRTGGSKMFVKVDTEVPVEELLRGILIQSGNDACVVVAENLAGSEENFANVMNDTAAKLGLKNSHFINATGLPEDGHVMTVRDLTILGLRIIRDFPEFYPYFSEKEFLFNGIKQPNRNLLLFRDPSFDGLKTGHAEKAGYGIVAAAIRDGRRIVGTVNGLSGEKERADEAQKLVEYGFRDFEKITLFKKDETISSAEIWFGKKDSVDLKTQQDISFTIPKYAKNELQVSVVYDGPLKAPVKKDATVANLIIKRKGVEDVSLPLVAAEDVKKISFFGHMVRAAKHHIQEYKNRP